MKTAIIQTRIDEDLKKSAEDVLSSIGMDMTSAIRLFLTQVVNQKRIPFSLLSSQVCEQSFGIAAEPVSPYYINANGGVQYLSAQNAPVSSIDAKAYELFLKARRRAEQSLEVEPSLDEINAEIKAVRSSRK